MGRGERGGVSGADTTFGGSYGAPIWVGCDLDNTLCDQGSALQREIRRHIGVELPTGYNCYAHTDYGVPRDAVERIFRDGEVFREVEPRPDGIAALGTLRARGQRITIVTDRFWYPENENDTRRWLLRHGVPFDELAMIRSAEKAAFVRDSGRTFSTFFEDRSEIAAAVAAYVPEVFLHDQPWNRGTGLPSNVVRIRDWTAWRRLEALGTGPRPLVIGLTGLPSAGKDSLVPYLLPLGFRLYGLGDRVREEAARTGVVQPTRAQQQDIGDRMRSERGPFVLAQLTAERIAADGSELAVISGLRNPGEALAFAEQAGTDVLLVAVDAPAETRYERARQRGSSRDQRTWDAFLEADARERGTGDPGSTRVEVGLTMALADIAIDNGRDTTHLAQQFAPILSRLALRSALRSAA